MRKDDNHFGKSQRKTHIQNKPSILIKLWNITAVEEAFF